MADHLTIFDAILPAMSAGFNDLLNPFLLASAFFYCLFVMILLSSRKQVLFLSVLFILSALVFSIIELYGGIDQLVSQEGVEEIVALFYLGVAAAFLIAGFVLLRSWQKLKQTGSIASVRWQYFRLFDPDHKPKRSWALMIVKVNLVLFLGFFSTLLNSFWPKSDYIYIVYSNLLANGTREFTFATFLTYSLVAVGPYIIFWIIFQFLPRIKGEGSRIAVSFLLISLAGFAMSLALGLALISLRILQSV